MMNCQWRPSPFAAWYFLAILSWRWVAIGLLIFTAMYWIWEQSARSRRRSIDYPYMGVKMEWRTRRRH